MRTVSNTSPIYNLACIDRLPLLREQFNEIWIPDAVAAELRQIPDVTVAQAVDQARQTGWIRMRPATNDKLIGLLMVDVHRGEAEAITLAVEMQADRLLNCYAARNANFFLVASRIAPPRNARPRGSGAGHWAPASDRARVWGGAPV